jgi:hypothetical protein
MLDESTSGVSGPRSKVEREDDWMKDVRFIE